MNEKIVNGRKGFNWGMFQLFGGKVKCKWLEFLKSGSQFMVSNVGQYTSGYVWVLHANKKASKRVFS